SCSGGLSRTAVDGVAVFSGCVFSEIDLYGIRGTTKQLTPTDTFLIAVSSPTAPLPPPSGSDNLVYPLRVPWTVTPGCGFAEKLNSCRFAGYHLGEDVQADAGTEVYAPADGIVKHIMVRQKFGNVVIIEH